MNRKTIMAIFAHLARPSRSGSRPNAGQRTVVAAFAVAVRKAALVTIALCIGLTTGCATKSPQTKLPARAGTAKPRSHTAKPSGSLVAQDILVVGRIIKVNSKAQFVLISFPIGCMPRPEQPLYVYRNGQKIGELKATRHTLDELVIADIVSGECAPGDEVADK